MGGGGKGGGVGGGGGGTTFYLCWAADSRVGAANISVGGRVGFRSNTAL